MKLRHDIANWLMLCGGIVRKWLNLAKVHLASTAVLKNALAEFRA